MEHTTQPMTPAQEQAWAQDARRAQARLLRNSAIAKCDWTQLPDAALTDAQKAAWAQYRQALRDVTQQASFAQTGEVAFPAEPVFNN